MERYGGCCSLYEIMIYLIRRYQRFGRSNFQEAAKLMHRNNHSLIDWSKFKFMVYDAPDQQKLRYQERYAILGTRLLFAFSHSYPFCFWVQITISPKTRIRISN